MRRISTRSLPRPRIMSQRADMSRAAAKGAPSPVAAQRESLVAPAPAAFPEGSLPRDRKQAAWSKLARRAVSTGDAGRIHRRPHPANRLHKPDKNRFADQKMPNIELDDLGQRRYRRHRVVAKPVPGMAFETKAGGFPGRKPQPLELGCALGAGGIAISAGVQFDRR